MLFVPGVVFEKENVNEGSAKLSFVITSDKFTFNGPCDGFLWGGLGGKILSASGILWKWDEKNSGPKFTFEGKKLK